ncbi:agmatine deiminase family protein [Helicobacter muridarum]|nr:agmatine deiminase family protein [Helicobacter muridarum]TLD98069.1 agmatine deiminase family protein [Helicobacter muridarum]
MFAEWEEQKGIVLIYPHRFCDFAPMIDEVQKCYDNIIAEVLKVEDLILILHPKDLESKKRVRELLQSFDTSKHQCHCVEIESNDIWARDCMPISIKMQKTQTIGNITNAMLNKANLTSEKLGLLGKIVEQDNESEEKAICEFANFGFNGWGLKYPANLDNQINNKLKKLGFFLNMKLRDIVLEGGSIDSNGSGLLLTTTQCLLESNRNPHLTKEQIENKLKDYLNVSNVLWLTRGFLEGDNTTDGHIDTLARFISEDTIAYVQCSDSNNSHFIELNAMERELEDLAKVYDLRLVALPLCVFWQELEESKNNQESSLKDSSQNKRSEVSMRSWKIESISTDCKTKRYLPASYINFLFLNNKHLLLPIYNKPTDSIALETLQRALPNYNIITIDCTALITQEGSLHCASMQFH